MNEIRNTIIIGGGPAGYTAALYAARADLNPLVIEGFSWGGQLMITSDVENYPGFKGGIMGPKLMEEFRAQAERFGAEFLTDDVTKVDFSERPFRVWVEGEEHRARTVIVATGASARWLGLPGETQFQGRGVSACATCDGAFFRDKKLIVVGGGDTAMEEAAFLTRFASKVYLIHRRDQMRASKIMQERVFANKKIEPIWNSVVTKYIADEKGEMRAVRLRNVKTNEERELEVAAVFVAIGHDPNTQAYRGKLETDPDGYLIAKRLVESKHPGIFIAGDVADRVYKQAVTAAGSGCAAALEAEKYLSELESHG